MAKIKVQNVNHPSSVRLVDAEMYQAMRKAYLAAVPTSPPGLTLAEIQKRLIAQLPPKLYPRGAKAGWWAKNRSARP